MTPSQSVEPLWTAQVAAAALLPDARLKSRLERLLAALDARPQDAFPQALADPHQAKAAYRFLANARVAASALVAGWQAATATRLADHAHVFVLHDTTTFSYTAQKQTTGLGWISHLAAARGFHCHTSLAVSADGVALGLVHQQYWSRPVKQMTRPQSRPMTEKESIKWLGGLEATATLLGGVPVLQRPRVVHLMDREGDVHEVLEQVIALGHGAIIRRYRPRCVAEPPGDADAALRQSPAPRG